VEEIAGFVGGDLYRRFDVLASRGHVAANHEGAEGEGASGSDLPESVATGDRLTERLLPQPDRLFVVSQVAGDVGGLVGSFCSDRW
jgi:hypothetical protein